MSARILVSMLLAFAVPGAGHVYLGRRARGVAFFCIVAFMFVVGLAAEGGLYTLAESRGALLRVLASLGSMGSGALYVLGRMFGPEGSVTAPTFEYGTTFTLTAGLMNLLLVLDCYDIGRKRKE
jgi:hypothetical protein